MVKPRIFPVVCLLLLAGCATSGVASPQKVSFGEARGREVNTLSAHKIASPDQFFSATVSAASVPQVTPTEELYQITIPVDTQMPVECLVFKAENDSAATLRTIVGEMLSDLPKNRVLAVDAGTFEHLPYLYQETLYASAEGAGTLKGLVVPLPSASVVCVHDEVGYANTFKRVVGSLVTSLSMNNANSQNGRYYEVLIWKLRDMNVGYTTNRFVGLAGGETRSQKDNKEKGIHGRHSDPICSGT